MHNARMKIESRAGYDLPAPFRLSEQTVYAAALLIFIASAVIILYFNQSMSGGMRMPGNWSMSMMWMPMPGQSWLGAALMFAGMWLAMMIAMMLPSTLPMLLLYRRAVAFRGESRLGFPTLALGSGYFLVWSLFGLVAYAGGLAISRAAMTWTSVSRIVPLGAAAGLIVAGVYQVTPWKSACLKHCRDPLAFVAHHLGGGWRGAVRLGLHHGAFCAACCWALMLIQLVLGVMNLVVMTAVAIAIALEKLLPNGETIARIIGAVAILGGGVLAMMWVIGLQRL
jgi:predicted metal-binding membrane protein